MIQYFLNIFCILINYYFYNLVNYLKKNIKILQKCEFIYNSNKIFFLKHISLFLIQLFIVNLFFSIDKFIQKIPFISGFYSFIFSIVLLIQLLSYFRIIKKLNSSNCFKKLNLNKNLYIKIYEHQYKIYFIYLIIVCYTFFYKK